MRSVKVCHVFVAVRPGSCVFCSITVRHPRQTRGVKGQMMAVYKRNLDGSFFSTSSALVKLRFVLFTSMFLQCFAVSFSGVSRVLVFLFYLSECFSSSLSIAVQLSVSQTCGKCLLMYRFLIPPAKLNQCVLIQLNLSFLLFFLPFDLHTSSLHFSLSSTLNTFSPHLPAVKLN